MRYPEAGLRAHDVREIRRIKARVEAERLPRGADPSLHTKLGRGGLADVEWTVQLLQLRHAAQVPALRTTGTLPALAAAVEAGLLDPDDGAVLAEAWTLASRWRNASVLWSAAVRSTPCPGRTRPRRHRPDRGLPGGQGEQAEDDYLRLTRRARAVVDRIFYA